VANPEVKTVGEGERIEEGGLIGKGGEPFPNVTE